MTKPQTHTGIMHDVAVRYKNELIAYADGAGTLSQEIQDIVTVRVTHPEAGLRVILLAPACEALPCLTS